jgi:hypothetical protein
MTPVFLNPDHVRRLFVELDSWVGTPWIHTANVSGPQRARKGVGGDCVTILATAYHQAGFIEELELPAHVAFPGLAVESEVKDSITNYLARFITAGRLIRVNPRREPPLAGDILTFKFRAGREHHVGAYRGGINRMFYHCPGPGREFCSGTLNAGNFSMALVSGYRLVRGGS